MRLTSTEVLITAAIWKQRDEYEVQKKKSLERMIRVIQIIISKQ